MFGVDNSVKLALVAARLGVVVVRHNIKSRLAQRQFGVVEVENIGLVLINQVLAAEEPLFSERRVHRRWVLVPRTIVLLMPLILGFDAGDAVGYDYVASGVEFLWVQALPPLALTIGLRQPRGVVAHAGERPFHIVPIGHLKPVPCVSRVVADAEAQPVRARLWPTCQRCPFSGRR